MTRKYCALAFALAWFGVAECVASAAADTTAPATLPRQQFSMVEAAERGDVSAINRLIIVGTPVGAVDEMGRTALHGAVQFNRLDAFKLLLAEGADINAVAGSGDTPWLLAGALGRAEMLQLMAAGGPDLSRLNRYGGTALIPACERGHVDAVRVLLKTGINVNHVNKLGWTCLLEIAALGSDDAAHVEVARLVLAAGADPNIADFKGKTALDHAKLRGLGSLAAVITSAGGR